MSNIRSLGERSRDFECKVAERLGERAVGDVHRVGHPRHRKKKKADFNSYLRKLGFERPVLLGAEKDGGLDVLWILPAGSTRYRPIVSVQCKNGEFSMEEADRSLGPTKRSLSLHPGFQVPVHVLCVLFNDYVCPEELGQKPLEFVPLGLSDLAPLARPFTIEML